MSVLPGEIRRLYERWGTCNYDEEIAQIDHGIKCALLAREHGADDALVVAALLHDVGHLIELDRSDGVVDVGRDDRHDGVGASLLGRYFPASVTAPVALHVEAKRFLCATNPGYLTKLSSGSLASLARQGGPMTPEEVGRFQKHPGADRAIALRRWDEDGKSTDAVNRSLDDFLPEVSRVLRVAI